MYTGKRKIQTLVLDIVIVIVLDCKISYSINLIVKLLK